MYTIYIKNYQSPNGDYITNESVMYSIPFTPGDENVLIDPKVVNEMGKTGSFEFSMNIGHPWYERILQMKTIFRIEYDGDTIFRGRVLTIDVGHYTGTKKVHCEGDFAFFLDSQVAGKKDEDRPKTNAYTYLQQLINNHNSQMAEGSSTDKMFILGEVPGHYSNASTNQQRVNPDSNYRYGSSSWKDTQNALNELAERAGGYFRTRYQNGSVYVDWLDSCYNPVVNSQPIELASNMIDITSTSEVKNIFTALIPIGSQQGKDLFIDGYQTGIHGNNNRILVPQILNVFSDAQLNVGFHSKKDYQDAIKNYGIIYKTETFSNADTKAKLWEYATDWIKNNYCGGINSFNVSALDMHHIDGTVSKYLVGDLVEVIYPDVDARDTDPNAVIRKTLTVMKIEYSLHNPEKNTYKIGIPNGILKKDYGDKASKKGGGGGSGPGGPNNDGDEDEAEWKKEFRQYTWDYVIKASKNSARYQEILQKYGAEAAAAIQKASFIDLSRMVNTPDESGGQNPDPIRHWTTMTLNAEASIMEFKEPYRQELLDELGAQREITAMVLNGAGRELQIKQRLPDDSWHWWDGSYGEQAKTVVSIAASEMSGKLGLSNIFGQDAENPGTESLTAVINGNGGEVVAKVVELVTGGQQDVEEAVEEGKTTVQIDGETGTQQVGKDSQGNWQVKLNDTITYVDENGVTRTTPGTVTAKDFDIPSIPSFKTKLAVVDQLVAGKATIGELNAVRARINAIEADYVTSSNLSATLSNMNQIRANNIISGSVAATNSFVCKGYTTSWLSKTVVTGVTYTKPSLGLSSSCVIDIINGGTVTGRVVTSWSSGSVSVSTETLTYVGR